MKWLIIGLGILAIFLLIKIIKIPKFGNMTLVTGGIKTGKTTMSIWLAFRQYKRQIRRWWIYNKILYPCFSWMHFKFAKNMKLREKPLFYANIPVAIKGYTPLTRDLIERKKRFRYGSVIYVCESSLVADSQAIKNPLINEEMLLLNKLIAHETKGGYIFYDTQSIGDNHYAVKRCLSTYLYIHHTKKIPFFCLSWVRELKYNDDNSTVNTFENDVEDTLQLVIIPKSIWKTFDCYCYSALTDHLPVEDGEVKILKTDKKKAKKIVTFRDYATIPKEYTEN